MTQPLPESADAAEAGDPDELTPSRYALERGLLVIGERTEVILVRHAQQVRTQTETSKPGGPSLSALGRHQAQLTGKHLAGEQIDAVYCSDLNRARETAQLIADAAAPGLEPVEDERLREVDMYGRDAGRPGLTAQMQIDGGEEFRRTLRFDAFPNTEPSADLRERIHGVVSELTERHAGGRILVVSHAGAICSLVANAISSGPDMFYFAAHASVSRVFHGDGRFVPHALNEVAHLRAEGALTF